MAARKVEGILLDVDYVSRGGKSAIRLFVRTGKGIEAFEDPGFRPYFFVRVDNAGRARKALGERRFGEGVKAAAVEEAKRANSKNVLRLEFDSVKDLTAARQEVKGLEHVREMHEYDIPFAKRWLLDHELQPMNGVRLSVEGNAVRKAELAEAGPVEFRVGAFDLETLSPGRFSDPKLDPIIMASVAGPLGSSVLSHGKQGKGLESSVLSRGKQEKRTVLSRGKQEKGIEALESEGKMIERLEGRIREQDLDIITTYNGDLFDFPYIVERAGVLGTGFAVSSDGSEPKVRSRGRDNAVRLKGVQHLDAYQMLRFLNRFAVVNLVKFDLESVVARLWGERKEKVHSDEINRIWDSGKGMERLGEYCAEDSEYTLKIARQYLPLIVELCRIVKQPLFEVSRASASLLVEQLLMNRWREKRLLIANKPDDSEAKQRLMQQIKGGYVKEPEAGLHENVAVLDFSSLYPTIIISHNVSPDSVGCRHKQCREKNSAPNKQWFCMEKEGILSSILGELFERRMKIKKQVKERGKGGEAVLLDARQHALKILMNSFYGYLGYARSRFYSRQCASAITAWARQYVKWVGGRAEKAGFRLIYSDTDSAFLVIPKGKEQGDVKKFVEQVNKKLPGVMNLELEGFYKRGIFVTKESGEGAKKKYALVDHRGNLKIVGFEYVRRDWARIAKETQREVIGAILQEGNPGRAVQIVRQRISALKSGKVPKRDLVVLTQIKKPLGKYESIGPHVAAAKKAVARGKELGIGSVIGYIVTRSGKSISDRAQLEEYVKEGNYDPGYYIQNQLLPAVMKIIREFDVSREDLLQGGRQAKLGAFG